MPDTWIGLAVGLLAIVPGFVATTAWARARTWRGPAGDLRTILQSLVLSAVIQVMVYPLTVWLVLPHRNDLFAYPWTSGLWFASVVLVLPLFGGLFAGSATDWLFPIAPPGDPVRWRDYVRFVFRWLFRTSAPPCAWDWFFCAHAPVDGKFVLIKFKDGSYIGGVFSDRSMALTSPEPHGLYLASEWIVDEKGDFVAKIPQTQGVMIPLTDDIAWVRVLGESATEGSTR